MPLPKDSMFFGLRDKLTDEQKEYVDSIFDNRLTMVNAKAGSGKTTLAVAAAKMLGRDLIYIFSPIQESALGFRPGTLEEKEKPYTQPLIDALLEIDENPMQVIHQEEVVETGRKKVKPTNDKVWVYPKSHIFARGTNIKGADKFVLIDEAQNFTRGELKKVLTRIADDVIVVVVGHVDQCDLSDPKKSGFQAYIDHFKSQPYCKICNLTKNFRGELADWADQLKW